MAHQPLAPSRASGVPSTFPSGQMAGHSWQQVAEVDQTVVLALHSVSQHFAPSIPLRRLWWQHRWPYPCRCVGTVLLARRLSWRARGLRTAGLVLSLPCDERYLYRLLSRFARCGPSLAALAARARTAHLSRSVRSTAEVEAPMARSCTRTALAGCPISPNFVRVSCECWTGGPPPFLGGHLANWTHVSHFGDLHGPPSPACGGRIAPHHRGSRLGALALRCSVALWWVAVGAVWLRPTVPHGQSRGMSAPIWCASGAPGGTGAPALSPPWGRPSTARGWLTFCLRTDVDQQRCCVRRASLGSRFTLGIAAHS